jgi:glutamine amidotransferase-like uncharacterized protein
MKMSVIKMNRKLLLTIFILSILTISSIVSAGIIRVNSFNNTSEDSIVKIRVVIYTDEDESDPYFYGPYGRTCYFVYALRDYTWQVGDITYSFEVDFISSEDLFDGKLTKENYDVFLYAPTKGDYESNPSKVKENLLPFIEDGGGYLGVCASAMMMATMKNDPKTSWEKNWKKRELGISCFQIEIKGGTPFYDQLFGRDPEVLGPTAVYTWVSGFNQSDYYINYYGGVCVDVIVNKSHPIFQGYKSDTRRIRWAGGPPLLPPTVLDRETSVLATFPTEEFSDNESTRVHYWEYTGGLRGIIKALFKSGTIHWKWGGGIYQKIMLFSGDWRKTDKIVETNYAGKFGITAEVYPNPNQARIVLSPIHPEYNVWWDGHIIEPDTDNNNIYEGLNRWTDVTPKEETPQDEFSFNYWIIRRSIAWASQKVPDNDLPPIYDTSQVSDIYLYGQSSTFTIIGNAKEEKQENISLDLYYRYSTDNDSWNDWMLYETDTDFSDGWIWEFNSPDGPGFYQFYSIRNAEFEDYIEVEDIPPGADAIVFVEG